MLTPICGNQMCVTSGAHCDVRRTKVVNGNKNLTAIGDSTTEFYFAYGSNLWIDQMIRRTGPIDQSDGWPRRVTLAGYQFGFTMRSDEGEFFANIEPAEDLVRGVLYRCLPGFLNAMDRYETGYIRHPVLVLDELGQPWQAITYIASAHHRSSGGRPAAEYLQRVLRGVSEFQFPENYLREIQAKGVPRSD